MTAKYTEGPWVDNGEGIICAHSGDVARIVVGSDGVCHVEMEGNARLIAAAPELLEALELAYEHINGGSGIKTGSEFNLMWGQIRSAIAKASGK